MMFKKIKPKIGAIDNRAQIKGNHPMDVSRSASSMAAS